MTEMSADLEMLAHIHSTVSPDTAYRARLLNELKSIHIVTPDDDKIAAELDLMVANILAGSSVGYALTITGKSGAGKSASLDRCLNAHPSFAPFEGRYNRLSLSLRATTPASTTLKTLGKELLQMSGYEMALSTDEDENWRTLIRRMKIMQTKVLVLDEFQHVLDAPTSKKYMHLTNSIKNLTQMIDWPIWLIICGIPEIKDFIARDVRGQLDRRAPLVEFEGMKDVNEDRERVEDTIYALAESCELELGFALTRDFVMRLMHGGIWRFGTTVHIIKNAIEKSLWDKNWSRGKRGSLTVEHFALGYKRLARNCPDETNVFNLSIKDWHYIQREVDDKGRLVDPASVKRRRSRSE
ncbi:TniB family NTP-binding protein [Rhizobium rhizogenes]|uniref:AAA+ ATPase domain-containing protein n=1 Tax=Rhizobium rhizogenes NBRC 13257 TaxID=1220581 RepID=A0AA87Q5M4_RHIRH|nr:TniB family NTP-binding protein [Rhizobium rhizogenes]NTG60139.1 AAA family ATPase [Rhizobium rhizogenes]NTG66690.1 AAA family ATPase [Rhizobium rhizogenes]NTG79662.1 AAA family ATPase [Rhizobium rhizogenes]NTH95342.1 AAA family ATPase [Rhizobium rhizogenes]NTI67553.1 AAA family ATPase [Rhizobium rhizogenes]